MKDKKLDNIREIAKALLHLKPVANKELPVFIQHPFIANNPLPIKDDKGNYNFIDIFKDKEDYQHHINMLEKLIDKKDCFTDIMYLMQKPYHLFFLNMCKDIIPTNEYSKCLASVWISTEFPNSDKNVPPQAIVEMFSSADPNLLMSKHDKIIFDEMPDVIEIYRGTYDKNNTKALSWTTDYETARWFATRFDDEGYILKAEINKKDVFAFFNDRNESEVVVNYKKIKKFTFEMVMKISI